jgi:hypothetical protein
MAGGIKYKEKIRYIEEIQKEEGEGKLGVLRVKLPQRWQFMGLGHRVC